MCYFETLLRPTIAKKIAAIILQENYLTLEPGCKKYHQKAQPAAAAAAQAQQQSAARQAAAESSKAK